MVRLMLFALALETTVASVEQWRQTHHALGSCQLQSQSGYLHVHGRDSSALMMYWFFPSFQDSVILWLGDSIGCSSVASVPDIVSCKVGNSWTDFSSVLSVDLPGIGFSGNRAARGGRPVVEQGCRGVGDDLVNFANTWLATNTQYREKKWYVFGEGSMGHCVPVVGHVFSQHFVGNFKGVGIGNADIDPNEQIKSIPMYLLQARSNLKIPPAGLKVCEMDSTIF